MAGMALNLSGYRTTTEAAEILGRKLRVVQLWLKTGTMRGVLVGRTWLVHKDEIARIKKSPPKLGRPRKKKR